LLNRADGERPVPVLSETWGRDPKKKKSFVPQSKLAIDKTLARYLIGGGRRLLLHHD